MKLTSLFAIVLAILTTLTASKRLLAAEEIFVGGLYGPIGLYSSTGSVINANFIPLSQSSQPSGMALSGNELFVVDDNLSRVGVYNATTGAVINANLITVQSPVAIAVSGSSLFITANNFTTGQAVVAEYTTSGTLVNGSLITGLSNAEGLVIIGTDLYVADADNGTVGKYTTSGTVVNANFITGLSAPLGLASNGTDLYVAEDPPKVSEYNLSGTLVTSWVPDSNPYGLAFLGSDLLVTLPNATFVTEYTASGQVVKDPFLSDASNPFSIVVGTPGGTPTPTPTPTPSPTITPTPPPHGGLSATVFYVDGSKSPQSGLADTILNFSAIQTGTPSGLYVRVQYSISGGTWTDLNDGSSGHMTYDPALKEFITSTANYPTYSSVSFRAISAAEGYSDSISNVVEPFNLASAKLRLSPPVLSVTGNGTFADLYCRADVASPTSGEALRVQSTTTPLNQGSWTDLADGHSGALTKSMDPTRYYLMDDKLPAASGVYFRVIASLTGYEDAVSTPIGAFKITPDTPPTVTLSSPHAKSGNGTASSPYVYAFGDLQFTAKATVLAGGSKIEGIALFSDDEGAFGASLTDTVTATYSPTSLGDHLIEAYALDSLGATGRFGTSPVYIRIVAATSFQEKEESSSGNGTSKDVTLTGKAFTQVINNGTWSDASTWKDSTGKNGVPGPNDFAIIYSQIYLSKPASISSVTLAYGLNGGGQIVGGTATGKNVVNTLTVTGNFSCYGAPDATIPFDFVHLILPSGSTCNLWNNSPLSLPSSTIDNYGTLSIHGGQGITGLANFNNYGNSNFAQPLALPPNAGADPSLDTRPIATNANVNSGLLNSDLVSKLIGPNGSTIITHDGASVVSNDGGSIISQDGSGLIGQDGSGAIPPQTGGALIGDAGGTVKSQGQHDETTPQGFVQTGGETNLDGVLIEENVTLNGGVLNGTGTIYGNLTNNSGYISPGHSAGAISVIGSFTQTAKGTLVIEDGGASANEFDQLQVAGKATLGGTLDLQLINGYKPTTLDTFSPLGYSSFSGKFATISSNATVHIDASGLNASVNPALPGPSPAASRNIATRAFVQTGENVIIGGFIVSGPAGSEKKVILRGIGPSLTKQGVQGALADPVLQLYKGQALLEGNDNWTSNEAAVKATSLAPSNPLESAIVTTLAPGAYTAILSGKNGGTGVGLVEVYDLAPDSKALLANISTRCDVQAGDNVLIGGFILEGAEPTEILVRAIGPSLTKEGISGALADPILDLYDANGAVITNDNWRGTQEQAIIATGVAPTNDKESAILATLPPGPYTAIVSGKNGGTGVALVEVYNIQ